MDGLAARTHEIGDLVEVIETIAAQASFLALNATLEAARAGQAGKSFTVVALEVKSLAAQMTEASEGMSERVASLRLAAIQAVETATAVDVSMVRPRRTPRASPPPSAPGPKPGSRSSRIVLRPRKAPTRRWRPSKP